MMTAYGWETVIKITYSTKGSDLQVLFLFAKFKKKEDRKCGFQTAL